MKSLPKSLQAKIATRKAKNAFRELSLEESNIDFSSNDYLGFAQHPEFEKYINPFLDGIIKNGATGSRLLSGNSKLYDLAEGKIADFHGQEAALVFNSGYNANIGFFSCVPQRGDIVFYDELIHASIRDGLRMGLAQNLNFKHNNFIDLEAKVTRWKAQNTGAVYVVTESVFSMDGDSPNLVVLVDYCVRNNLYLILDEAHALGVFGEQGGGLVQQLNIQDRVFAQIVTFGKGLGSHGAAILGSLALREYLINFSRSFIYTTALPAHAIASILGGYQMLSTEKEAILRLQKNIAFFNLKIKEFNLIHYFIPSNSAIHCCVISGVDRVKKTALLIQDKGFSIKPILSPTVPIGKERLRFCLHTYNTFLEIESVLKLVSKSLMV